MNKDDSYETATSKFMAEVHEKVAHMGNPNTQMDETQNVHKRDPELGDLESALKDDPSVDPPIGEVNFSVGDLDSVYLNHLNHRPPEKEGRTPQEEKTFFWFVIACVGTGMAIGIMMVAFF